MIVLGFVVANGADSWMNRYFGRHNLHGGEPVGVNVLSRFLRFQQGDDSLGAMYPAIRYLAANPKGDVYQQIFFNEHIKFLYPLTSLLPYYALAHFGSSYWDLVRISKVATWLACWLMILLTIAIALRRSGVDPWKARNWRANALLVVTVAVAGITFQPLIKGYTLGQIQVLLSLGFTFAFYCWMTGREKTAGAAMAIIALVKPQYGLFLLWALLRRKYGAAVSFAICLAIGVLVSCMVFGWHNNLAYLTVLKSISHAGESYKANQTMNGLLNRLLFTGTNLTWDPHNYVPFNPVVYWGTLLSSAGLILLALFYRWGRGRRGSMADFACLALVATMASPVAWEHHYEILLPILAWLWFGDYAKRVGKRDAILFGLAYLLVGNVIVAPAALATIPVMNILQSYVYFGAVLSLILLVRSRAEANVDSKRAAFVSS